mmetsp:Transcript_10/g.21  ORF Transcript_10/g.21 Transcript_10/m.21 type:complete len:80 (-) Transcript_10:774-1013(-)
MFPLPCFFSCRLAAYQGSDCRVHRDVGAGKGNAASVAGILGTCVEGHLPCQASALVGVLLQEADCGVHKASTRPPAKMP